jgi:hypothetical protein
MRKARATIFCEGGAQYLLVLTVQLALSHFWRLDVLEQTKKSLVPTTIRIPERPVSSLDTIPTYSIPAHIITTTSSSSSLLPIRPKSHISQMGFIALHSTKAYRIILIMGTSNATINNVRCWQSVLILDGLSKRRTRLTVTSWWLWRQHSYIKDFIVSPVVFNLQ